MKVAVVTGGGSGIGAGIVERLRADGLRVAILDLNPPAADDGFAYRVDVTDRDAVAATIADIRAKAGAITVLVNSAGTEKYRRFRNLSFEEWQRVVDVNLHGVFHCVQAVLPDMLEAGWGRVVNISSSSTHSGQPFMAAYVAAKSAVNGLTKSLALELGPAGITVNAIPPGFIDTPMLRRSEAKQLLGGTIDEHIERTPVRRAGRPADIAAMCSFLISDDASYITGQIIGVNGGRNT